MHPGSFSRNHTQNDGPWKRVPWNLLTVWDMWLIRCHPLKMHTSRLIPRSPGAWSINYFHIDHLIPSFSENLLSRWLHRQQWKHANFQKELGALRAFFSLHDCEFCLREHRKLHGRLCKQMRNQANTCHTITPRCKQWEPGWSWPRRTFPFIHIWSATSIRCGRASMSMGRECCTNHQPAILSHAPSTTKHLLLSSPWCKMKERFRCLPSSRKKVGISQSHHSSMLRPKC